MLSVGHGRCDTCSCPVPGPPHGFRSTAKRTSARLFLHDAILTFLKKSSQQRPFMVLCWVPLPVPAGLHCLPQQPKEFEHGRMIRRVRINPSAELAVQMRLLEPICSDRQLSCSLQCLCWASRVLLIFKVQDINFTSTNVMMAMTRNR